MTSTNSRKIFAQNLNRYLQSSGRSRKDICDALNIPYSTFSDWCNGIRYPRIDKLEMLARYFGIRKTNLIEAVASDAGNNLYPTSTIEQSINTLEDGEWWDYLSDHAPDCVMKPLHDAIDVAVVILRGASNNEIKENNDE